MAANRSRSSDITPSPYRLLQSLRDVGYDFVTALADIVDNSITAGARRVDIEIRHRDGPPRVVIADDGAGMTRARLVEALRLGSEREYGVDDLGKFGLGLKTASLSQCRCLTVATRHSPKQYRIATAVLDLDAVAASNRWRLTEALGPEIIEVASKWLGGSTGSVVIWQKLDRVVPGDGDLGGWDRRRLQRLADSAATHLSMVFHRFIEGVVGRRKLRITVNGKRLGAWNPFALGERHTKSMPEHRFEFSGKAAIGDVLVQGHVLPHRDLFSSIEAFELLSGPRKWNRQQGFYVYRNQRLIQSGGWCGMRAADEHTKLARIVIDFPSTLDDLFNVNIAKMRVAIPSELRVLLERAVLDVVKAAQSAYRTPLKIVRPDSAGSKAGGLRSSGPISVPAFGELMLALRAAALSTGDSRYLARILARLRRDAPDLAAAAGLLPDRGRKLKQHRPSSDVG